MLILMSKEMPTKLGFVIFQVFRMNLEKLSKPELLTLFSILEGELEARDLVIEALKVGFKYQDKQQTWQQYHCEFCRELYPRRSSSLVQNPV